MNFSYVQYLSVIIIKARKKQRTIKAKWEKKKIKMYSRYREIIFIFT